MNNKLMMTILAGLMALVLAACGGNEEGNGYTNEKEDTEEVGAEAESDDDVQEDEEEDAEDTEKEVYKDKLEEEGDKTKDETGITEFKKNKELNKTIENEPLDITIKSAKLLKKTDMPGDLIKEVNFMAEENLEEDDDLTYLQLDVDIENTEERDVEWYGFNQIVTDEKEQIDAVEKEFLSQDTGEPILGKTEKEEIYGFVVDNPDADEFRVILHGTMDADSYEDINGQVEYTFSFDDEGDGEITQNKMIDEEINEDMNDDTEDEW